MTKSQTKACFETAIQAAYFGPTKEARIVYCLRQVGISLATARDFIATAIEAKLMHRNVSGGRWISVTPFMIGISNNFDELAADTGKWTDEA